MDFNALVSKLRQIEPTDISNPNATVPESTAPKASPVILSEDAQMRVLAGVSTVLAESTAVLEAKKEVVAEKAVSKKQQKFMGMVHTAQKGEKPASKEVAKVAKDMKKKDAEDFASTKHKGLPEKKKSAKESLEATVDEILEASKPDANKDGIPDYAQDGKGANDLGKGKKPEAKKAGKKGMSAKQAKYFGKKNESIKEGANKSSMMADAEKMSKAEFIKKYGAENADTWDNMNESIKEGKYKSDAQRKAIHANKMKKESVKESMSFLDAIKIVKESNGEMGINAVDTPLWQWSKRVAASKVGGGLKAEAYAAKIYESFGGSWDVSRKVLAE
jgi:hypothetical protein